MVLIIGRTCTGKDTLAKNLCKETKMKILMSYTTRPKRYANENTHVFITPEESAKINDKVAVTEINGYEYFATKSQVQNSDVYIIDPNGLYELINNCPNESFQVIYIESNKDIAKNRAAQRGADPTKESVIFDKRYDSENKQFSDFENKYAVKDQISPNCKIIYRWHNDFTKGSCINAISDICHILKGEKKSNENERFIETLKAQALSHGAELTVDYFIDINHLYHYWYGGDVAKIKYKDYTFTISANGDVFASLIDENGEEIARVKDKGNHGVFYDRMRSIINNDEQLTALIAQDRILFDFNNWWECFITLPNGEFVDIMWDLDGYRIDEAIIEVLESMDQVIENLNA